MAAMDWARYLVEEAPEPEQYATMYCPRPEGDTAGTAWNRLYNAVLDAKTRCAVLLELIATARPLMQTEGLYDLAEFAIDKAIEEIDAWADKVDAAKQEATVEAGEEEER